MEIARTYVMQFPDPCCGKNRSHTMAKEIGRKLNLKKKEEKKEGSSWSF